MSFVLFTLAIFKMTFLYENSVRHTSTLVILTTHTKKKKDYQHIRIDLNYSKLP